MGRSYALTASGRSPCWRADEGCSYEQLRPHVSTPVSACFGGSARPRNHQFQPDRSPLRVTVHQSAALRVPFAHLFTAERGRPPTLIARGCASVFCGQGGAIAAPGMAEGAGCHRWDTPERPLPGRQPAARHRPRSPPPPGGPATGRSPARPRPPSHRSGPTDAPAAADAAGRTAPRTAAPPVLPPCRPPPR